MKFMRCKRIIACFLVTLLVPGIIECHAQEPSSENAQKEGQLTLRRTVRAREYQGREVEGEDRVVGPGDSVWRMLVQEKGVPENRFSQYLLIIRRLNPQLKSLDVLKVGDTIFVPLRPEELLGSQPAVAKKEPPRAPIAEGTTKDYRVKAGDHLYQILREQLGIQGERELARHYALIKDLNPEKKNWDGLQEGEVIRLPVPARRMEIASSQTKEAPEVAATSATKPAGRESKPVMETATVKEAVPKERAPSAHIGAEAARLPASQNFALLTRIVEALGSEVQRGGHEVLSLNDGTVRLDKNAFPVVYSPQLRQKIILDIEDGIPASLRSKLADPSVSIPVVSLNKGASLQAAVSHLLSGLGYQPLPGDRPVVISDGGIALEVKGNWVVLAPEESNKMQEVFVITFSARADEIPEYLKTALSQRGLHLRDIVLSDGSSQAPVSNSSEPKESPTTVKRWPVDKREFIDSVLRSLGIPFGGSETLAAELRPGIRWEVKADRIFEVNGKRTALVFQRIQPEIKKALQESGMAVHELDIAALSRKEIVARFLSELGEQASYREHRFAAANGADKERLNIAAWGFLLPNRGMFVTDREIPQSLHRFFFEKGLEIVYFQ
jgi:hypothetical protein